MEATSEIFIFLKAIAAANPPNWQKPLKAYPSFKWDSIGAIVLDSDRHGATKVSWCGHLYTRRAGENKKYGAAIWFSRGNGKTEDGETNYIRLITFRIIPRIEIEGLPEYVIRAMQ